MPILVSKNEQSTHEILGSIGYDLKSGDMLIVANEKAINEAEEWLDKNGVWGVFFNPEYPCQEFSGFNFESSLYGGVTTLILSK